MPQGGAVNTGKRWRWRDVKDDPEAKKQRERYYRKKAANPEYGLRRPKASGTEDQGKAG